MLESAREFVSSHNDVSRLVRDARRFTVQVPLVGKITVPPPDQLAFYGVLTVLGVTELIPWPVALGLGVGHALATRHATEAAAEVATEVAETAVSDAFPLDAPEEPVVSARKTPVKRAPARSTSAPRP